MKNESGWLSDGRPRPRPGPRPAPLSDYTSRHAPGRGPMIDWRMRGAAPDPKFGSPPQLAALAHHVGAEPGDRREFRADTAEGSAGISAPGRRPVAAEESRWRREEEGRRHFSSLLENSPREESPLPHRGAGRMNQPRGGGEGEGRTVGGRGCMLCCKCRKHCMVGGGGHPSDCSWKLLRAFPVWWLHTSCNLSPGGELHHHCNVIPR